MVTNPMDFFIRRTGRLYFDIQSVRSLMDPITDELARLLKSGEKEISVWREILENELEEHSDFSVERV